MGGNDMQQRTGVRVGRFTITWRIVLVAAISLVFLAFPIVVHSKYLHHLMIVLLIFATAATGWNVLGGFGGQVSLGHAVYFGLGAYAAAVVFMKWGVTPWVGMIIGGVVAVLVSMVIGYPCFQLGGRYFSMATLVLGEVVMTIFLNWPWVGGAVGLFMPMVPESLYSLQFHSSKLPYYYIALGLLGIAILMNYAIDRSQMGYYLRAIKDDPVAARSLGINLTKYKLLAMAVSSLLAAVAGSLYAQYLLYIDPLSVMVNTISTQIMLIAALGGMGSIFGPLIGALVLIPIGELARAYFGGGGRAVNLIIFGALVIIVAIYLPGGLVTLPKRLRRRQR